DSAPEVRAAHAAERSKWAAPGPLTPLEDSLRARLGTLVRGEETSRPPELAEPAGASPQRISSIPIQLRGGEMLPADVLVAMISQGHGAPISLHPEDIAISFTTEDGAERTCWVRPRDRIVRANHSEAALAERLLRSVLELWDFRDPEGWRSIWAQIREG